jgi:Tfp pilus assembly protein PilO
VTRKTGLLGLVGVLVLMLVWFELFYRPETSHITSLQNKDSAAHTSLVALDDRYAALVSSEKQLPAERRQLRALEAAVPNDPQLDSLVTSMYAAAKRAGMQISSVSSPQPDSFGSTEAVATSGVSQLTLGLNVSGTPSQLVKLVNILNAEPRLFVLDNLDLTYGQVGSSGAPVQSTTLSVRTFYADAGAATAGS